MLNIFAEVVLVSWQVVFYEFQIKMGFPFFIDRSLFFLSILLTLVNINNFVFLSLFEFLIVFRDVLEDSIFRRFFFFIVLVFVLISISVLILISLDRFFFDSEGHGGKEMSFVLASFSFFLTFLRWFVFV